MACTLFVAKVPTGTKMLKRETHVRKHHAIRTRLVVGPITKDRFWRREQVKGASQRATDEPDMYTVCVRHIAPCSQ